MALLNRVMLHEADLVLKKGYPLRIGETTVCSTHPHYILPELAGVVEVNLNLDAGQVFYGRKGKGEILHLDIFHDIALLNPEVVSRAISDAIKATRLSPDYIDIQTAVGGGRVSGSLNYGQNARVKEAHKNHVHITTTFQRDMVAEIIWLVSGVEQAIIKQGVELRQIEAIELSTDIQREGLMNDYATGSDSMLFSEESYDEYKAFNELEPLVEELADWQLVKELLTELGEGRDKEWLDKRFPGVDLEGKDLFFEPLEEYWMLNGKGMSLLRYVRKHEQELSLKFNMVLRKQVGKKSISGKERLIKEQGGNRRRTIQKKCSGDLAVPDTLLTWFKRDFKGPFKREYIQYFESVSTVTFDICLLLDSSASMAGPRLQAAKQLALHLALQGRNRVAVLTFQERQAEIKVPFTRDIQAVESGLNSIIPFGLTPLAAGLEMAQQYISKNKVHHPLLILITDGIPTVAMEGLNPLEDALRIAEGFKQSRIPLVSLGLEPNRAYLKDLSKRAGGSFYVLSEINRESLMTVIHRESVLAR